MMNGYACCLQNKQTWTFLLWIIMHRTIYSICWGHSYAFRKKTGWTVTGLTILQFNRLGVEHHMNKHENRSYHIRLSEKVLTDADIYGL